MDEYTPLGVRSGAIDPDALHEGVPQWLGQSLKDWAEDALDVDTGRGRGLSAERLRTIERHCKVALSWGTPTNRYALRSFLLMADGPTLQQQFLWAVDYLCTVARPWELTALESILKQGGSAWRISTVGTPHLERRVPDSAASSAVAATRSSGCSGTPWSRCGGSWSGSSPTCPDARITEHPALGVRMSGDQDTLSMSADQDWQHGSTTEAAAGSLAVWQYCL